MLVKTVYICETQQHTKKSHILSQFLQQSMTILGETSRRLWTQGWVSFFQMDWLFIMIVVFILKLPLQYPLEYQTLVILQR